ncbi:MAG: DUF4282 domain-containing protein [Beijerinckiaceae bacterium]
MGSFFQWDKFVTPQLVKVFYYLNLVLIGFAVLGGIGSAIAYMRFSLFGGLGTLIGTLILGVLGVILARMMAELFMIFFRVEEHLRAVRIRWEA